ncbi:MAG: 3'(2'),5'-bisphosphate nucleotidase [Chloroflexi bacterium RBG_19FT_COMBO_47_9]|nr:MAG: 3'(2'),5'-bisphosphate nucleotidase [Chloroflexi bacterium RBG_19FT_COMBO_47_9]
MIDITNPQIDFAVQSVRKACLLVRKIQRELVVPALTKSDKSPVTVADFASQALVAYYLQQSFPNEGLVAEEDASELRPGESSKLLEQITGYIREFISQATPETVCEWIDRGTRPHGNRFWTLDPVDGTKGFLRRDQYAVALALVDGGKVEIGVLGCPNLAKARRIDLKGQGSLTIAVRGQGTWTCPIDNLSPLERLQVSDRSELVNSRLLRSFESGHTNSDNTEKFLQVIGSQVEPVLMDSQAKYSLLASGEGEILLRLLSKDQPEYREMIWDQAAGSIILEEAGGKITDLAGRTLDFSSGRTLSKNRGILASNGKLHSAALEALRSIGI